MRHLGQVMPGLKEVRLRVGPYSARDVTIHFEPTGAEYVLLSGDWFDVAIGGEGTGIVEIGHTPTDLVVGAWVGASTVVEAQDGSCLDV